MAASHPYIPATDDELTQMLGAIGMRSFDDLLAAVPRDIREGSRLDLPPRLTEEQVVRLFQGKAARGHADMLHFLGAGVYDHVAPAAVDAIIQRSEFCTAYTPYQAEVSQGTLQAIYEFQTLVCELYGMEVANASVYDGASALTEAALLARAQTGRSRIVFAGPVHPYYRRVLESCTAGLDIEFVDVQVADGGAEPRVVGAQVDSATACVVVQQPNFYGIVEDVAAVADRARAAGALLVVVADPIAMGILEAPGRQGADVVVGEGQSLGISPSFGGPALGLFATRDELKRRLPGRLVGRTVEGRGQQAFVLTLQTREQHIRREKATSNICTNESLMALAATVYLSLLGPQGLRAVAETCAQNAHYAAEQIAALKGYRLVYGRPFFQEFVVECPLPAREAILRLMARRILPGVDMAEFGGPANQLMVAVTERRTKADIDALVTGLDTII